MMHIFYILPLLASYLYVSEEMALRCTIQLKIMMLTVHLCSIYQLLLPEYAYFISSLLLWFTLHTIATGYAVYWRTST